MVVRFEIVAKLYATLVVDDDPQVLAVVAEILAAPGFTVLTAHDGYEAIRILVERHVDLMITDARMPGLDGIQLGLQAKLMRPRLHIIYITAFADAARDARHGKVLRKPVRAAELVRTVEQELKTTA